LPNKVNRGEAGMIRLLFLTAVEYNACAVTASGGIKRNYG
jgi:hypothetical protein